MKNFSILPQVVLFILFICLSSHSAAQENGDVDKTTFFKQIIAEYQSYEEMHGHTIRTDNVEMHYKTWGDPSALPFVWVHGTTFNSYEVMHIADRIVALGCYLIAIDYYGHGKTPIPKKEVSVYHVADDIKFLLNHLGIDNALIGGWSRGGTISTAFYDEYPESVLGIVLEDGGSVNWRRPYHKLNRDTIRSRIGGWPLDFSGFATREEAYFHYRYSYDESSQLYHVHSIGKSSDNRWTKNPGLAEWLTETSVDDFITTVFTSTLSPLFQYSTLNLEPKIVYRNLHVPLLICDPRTDDDWNYDFTEDNRALAEQHPELITHRIYEDTYHAVKLQRPEMFMEDLSQFIQKVRRHHSRY